MKKAQAIKIRYIDGVRLQQAALAGCEEVITHETELNKINVFPIPDKDTGSNLKKTLEPVLHKDRYSQKKINQCSLKIAEAVASAAMGYSGIIYAQFFMGFAKAVEAHEKIDTVTFSQAVSEGVTKAYASLDSPVEGTVLSVLKAWSTEILRLSDTERDFVSLLKESYSAAETALRNTPRQLDILRKHKVVDSGGQAFIHFLKGILQLIDKGKPDISSLRAKSLLSRLDVAEKIDTVLFCAECCIRKKNLRRLDLMDELNASGREVIFYSSSDFAKIHVSCPDPDKIFSIADQFGEMSSRNVYQFSPGIAENEKRPLAFVADTTCDISEEIVESNDIFFIPIKIHAGDRVFTDRQDIVPEEFYHLMSTSPVLLKTSQPNIMDFIRTFKHLRAHYRSIISVHLSKNLSGTHQTALQAARSVDENRISIIDGKNISVGLGLVLLEGIQAFHEGLEEGSILERVEKAVDRVEIFIGLPTLKYLVMGGRITKTKGLIGRILNVNPILSINKEGKLESVGKARGIKKLEQKVLDLAIHKIQSTIPSSASASKDAPERHQKSSTAVAHTNAPHAGKRLAEKICDVLGEKPALVMNASPVLGAHAGIGAFGIAIMKGSSEFTHEETR